MLHMFYQNQNVMPLGIQPQLYQYQTGMAGLSGFPAQYGGQVGQVPNQMLNQGGFTGFPSGALGYAAYPFVPTQNGMSVVNPINGDNTNTGFVPTVHQPPTATQNSRKQDEDGSKDYRNRSRDRNGSKKTKEDSKYRDRDQQHRDAPARQSEHNSRAMSGPRGGGDSKYQQYQNGRQQQTNYGQESREHDRRFRDDRSSREREKSRTREGRDNSGPVGGYHQGGGQPFQKKREEEKERDNLRKDKDRRTANSGYQANQFDKGRDGGFREKNNRYDNDQGDSWKQRDRQPEKGRERDREQREREQNRDRERDRTLLTNQVERLV